METDVPLHMVRMNSERQLTKCKTTCQEWEEDSCHHPKCHQWWEIQCHTMDNHKWTWWHGSRCKCNNSIKWIPQWWAWQHNTCNSHKWWVKITCSAVVFKVYLKQVSMVKVSGCHSKTSQRHSKMTQSSRVKLEWEYPLEFKSNNKRWALTVYPESKILRWMSTFWTTPPRLWCTSARLHHWSKPDKTRKDSV